MNSQKLVKKIGEIYPYYNELAIKTKGEEHYNLQDAAINYLMGDLENQALLTIYDELISQNIRVSSLVFDGIMVYKVVVRDLKELFRELRTGHTVKSWLSNKVQRKDDEFGL